MVIHNHNSFPSLGRENIIYKSCSTSTTKNQWFFSQSMKNNYKNSVKGGKNRLNMI